MFARKPPLPEDRLPAWRAFLDAAEVVEGGRRYLLATLPTGRVEPVPVAVGIDALQRAIADARGWMDDWRLSEVEHEWTACRTALDEAEAALPQVREVAATTGELEELLAAVEDVVAPLDAFADAERALRRTWRLPRDRAG